MEQKVIYFSDMLRQMNAAMLNNMQVNLKAWKTGRSANDPEAGTLKTYTGVYVTSHSKTGSYRLMDPLTDDPEFKFRRVNEAMITEFMGKKVIW